MICCTYAFLPIVKLNPSAHAACSSLAVPGNLHPCGSCSLQFVLSGGTGAGRFGKGAQLAPSSTDSILTSQLFGCCANS